MARFYGANAKPYGGQMQGFGAFGGGGGATGPVVRDSTARDTNATRPFVFDIPAGTLVGDTLVAIGAVQSSASMDQPAGWTERHDIALPTSAGQARMSCLTRVAQAGDAGTSVNVAPAVAVDNTTRFWCFAISGADQVSPIDVTGALTLASGSLGAGVPFVGPTVTTTGVNRLLLHCFAGESTGTATVLAIAAGPTPVRADNNAANQLHGAFASEIQAAAGLSTARSVSLAGTGLNGIGGVTVGIKSA